MMPTKYRSRNSSIFLSGNYHVNFGPSSTIAKIKGCIKKQGLIYMDAIVVAYNKANLQPIASQKPDENGNYQFLGLNTDLKAFIVGFDKKQQFNAVIQDNVVPK